MSKQEKYAYLLAICSRYTASDRAQKTLILDEHCASTQLGRKYAITQLNRLRRAHDELRADRSPQDCHERLPAIGGHAPAKLQRVGRKPVYAADAAVVAAIESIWHAANKPCSKRLVATLPLWLKHYEKAHGTLSAASRALMRRISPASIDRLLRGTRLRLCHTLHGLSGTVPASDYLRGLIPVRTHFKGVDRPGFMEADTVAHCGSTIAGEFFWTFACTDIYSGWSLPSRNACICAIVRSRD